MNELIITEKSNLTAIADAVRSKTGVTAPMTLSDIANSIYNIETGSSGGGNSGEEWIGDGKTHLWIKIAAEGRMDVPLYFSQTVSNGVTIDWGDGSATETFGGNNVNTSHVYASIGEYIITFDVAKGCTIKLGFENETYNICGSTNAKWYVYYNMFQMAEIGNSMTRIESGTFRSCYSFTSISIPNSVTSIGNSVFRDCYSLTSISIPNSVTSIGEYAFGSCYSLTSITIPNSVTSVSKRAFYFCYSLASIIIPNSVTSIESEAFAYCYCMKFYDFSKHTSVPTLSNTNAFYNIRSDCEIRVPMALVDEWKTATNWATYADYIVGV